MSLGISELYSDVMEICVEMLMAVVCVSVASSPTKLMQRTQT